MNMRLFSKENKAKRSNSESLDAKIKVLLKKAVDNAYYFRDFKQQNIYNQSDIVPIFLSSFKAMQLKKFVIFLH